MKTLRFFGWAVIFAVTLLLAACASHTPKVAGTDMMSGSDVTMTQPEEQKLSLERRENALAIRGAWLDERELQLAQRESDLNREKNYLAINQAWLNERETRLEQRSPDLTRKDDLLAFEQAWLDKREGLAMSEEDRATRFVKLAGADSLLAKSTSSPIKVEAGRCYAKVAFPAEYKTVAVIKPIELPAGEKLPVLYQSVTEKVKVTDEQTRWEEVICGDRMTECRIIEIQRSLSRGGYNPGPIDGILGQQTMAAVNAFQKDFNLTVANHLTIETVKALDANF